jgi:hypothetical protein
MWLLWAIVLCVVLLVLRGQAVARKKLIEVRDEAVNRPNFTDTDVHVEVKSDHGSSTAADHGWIVTVGLRTFA